MNFKEIINSNKRQIVAFAFNKFQATFVNPLNGKRDELTRTLNGYAHLRFTQIARFTKTGVHTLSIKDYKYNYIYYTTSTTFDNQTKKEDKIERNLTDLCFNVRKEVLDNDFGLKDDSYYFLVDTGVYFVLVSKKEARQNVLNTHLFNGRNTYTVRCPNRLIRKTTTLENAEIDDEHYSKMLQWDAKYIQNVTYSKYRVRNGYIKVEGFKDEKLQVIQYFVSTGELKKEFEAHGMKYSAEYFRVLANKGGSIKKENREFKFSRVTEVTDITTTDSSELEEASTKTTQALPELGYPLQYSTNLKEKEYCNGKPNYVGKVEESSRSELAKEVASTLSVSPVYAQVFRELD